MYSFSNYHSYDYTTAWGNRIPPVADLTSEMGLAFFRSLEKARNVNTGRI
jgi:hypothetical protein